MALLTEGSQAPRLAAVDVRIEWLESVLSPQHIRLLTSILGAPAACGETARHRGSMMPTATPIAAADAAATMASEGIDGCRRSSAALLAAAAALDASPEVARAMLKVAQLLLASGEEGNEAAEASSWADGTEEEANDRFFEAEEEMPTTTPTERASAHAASRHVASCRGVAAAAAPATPRGSISSRMQSPPRSPPISSRMQSPPRSPPGSPARSTRAAVTREPPLAVRLHIARFSGALLHAGESHETLWLLSGRGLGMRAGQHLELHAIEELGMRAGMHPPPQVDGSTPIWVESLSNACNPIDGSVPIWVESLQLTERVKERVKELATARGPQAPESPTTTPGVPLDPTAGLLEVWSELRSAVVSGRGPPR
jgi:hypothetical protein